MTKADSPKPPPKLETITLKVFIHCEGCRRKVRRIIRVVDGVEDVTVDSASGKVTVTGTADSKAIIQRLQKYGKHAELWPSSNPAPTAPAKAGGNQPKPSNNNGSDNNSKKKGNAGGGGGDKAPATAENESKKGGGKEEATNTPDVAKGEDTTVAAAASEKKPEKGKEANSVEASGASTPPQNGGNSGGGGGKKGGKKGGNGNNNNSNSGVNAPPEPPSSTGPIHDLPILSAPNTSVVVSANKSLAPYDSIQTGYSYHSAEYATHMFSDENANNCSIM